VKAAAIYLRMSQDRDGSGLGVKRQLEDCRAWADRHGATLAEVYEDNDVSAYSGKPRPRYRQMCEDIKEGRRDGVIAYHGDRLHRSPRELEDFIALIEAAQIKVVTVSGGDYDLSTSDGRAMARVVGAFARKESEDKSRRIKRQKIQSAQAGKRSGGGDRGYGYTSDHKRVVVKEARIIKEASERILAGDSLRSVCQDLNDRHVPTVRGGQWSQTVLRTILTSGRISGQVEHHGEIIGPAEWPAIVPPSTTARLRSVLLDPDRRTNRTPRTYPLTGLVFCGLCGAKMVARPRGDGRRRYVCARGPNLPGCGKAAVLAEHLEGLIRDGVLHALDSPNLRCALASEASQAKDADGLTHQLTDDRAQLDELAALYGKKELTMREWSAAKNPINQRIADTERRLSQMTGSSALEDFIDQPGALRDQWQDLSPARQRAIVAAVLDSITVGPAVRGRNTFDPSRIDATWKV
jgi:DNA invertase Pin-like site-specific DNA recombinase